MNVFIDCETIPTTEQWFIDSIDIQPPGNYKKPESIQKWKDEHEESEKQAVIDKTALDTSLAQIVCICYAIGDSEVIPITRFKEIAILAAFFEELHEYRTIRLIGHNIKAFDIPLIYHRAIINGIRPHKAFHMNYKPWDSDAYDTMTEWAGARERISQGRLARLLGIETQETTGADILQLYRDGNMDEIVKKCTFDVEQNRKIYKRMIGES